MVIKDKKIWKAAVKLLNIGDTLHNLLVNEIDTLPSEWFDQFDEDMSAAEGEVVEDITTNTNKKNNKKQRNLIVNFLDKHF